MHHEHADAEQQLPHGASTGAMLASFGARGAARAQAASHGQRALAAERLVSYSVGAALRKPHVKETTRKLVAALLRK